MPGTAGQDLSATQYNLDILAGTIIARTNRQTNSTASASAREVMRLDNVNLISGRSYQVMTNSLLVFSSIVNDTGSARISFSTSGAATTASPILSIGNTSTITTTNNGMSIVLSGFLHPSSDATYSFLLYTSRVAGTGNISLVGTAGEGTTLLVIDRGLSVNDTGTDL